MFSLLVFLLGIPFDRTIMYHRWIGRFTLILLTIHVFWAWQNWIANGLTIASQLNSQKYLFGLLGWISLILITLFSLPWIRRKQFEIFYYSHTLVYAYFVLGNV